ncbi:MAG TPA: ABC transporter permease [Burkholderiaceae bacterium]|nr:ABC transporter permease [Burkholderiaceae bacterium]
MRRIAILSILHDRGKLIGSLVGVAVASALGFTQIGLYRGFEESASTVIDHVGGDLWAIPRGIGVIDFSQVMSVAPRDLLLSHPCVADVRALLYGFSFIQRASGTRSTGIIVAVEPRAGREIPWGDLQGDPVELGRPLRVSVDRTDLDKLELPERPYGRNLEINGQQVTVALVTAGIRSFTLNPYVFTTPTNARRLLNVGENEAMFYVVDLADKACGPRLAAWLARSPDVELIDASAWSAKTRRYWVTGSGAGAALAFTALLGLVVGGVIVGQTLYAMTKEHLLELATLKAVGARPLELAGFVAWQVAFLAASGVVSGLLLTIGLRKVLTNAGLTVVVSPETVGLGILATLVMCGIASVASLSAVLRVEAARVLR